MCRRDSGEFGHICNVYSINVKDENLSNLKDIEPVSYTHLDGNIVSHKQALRKKGVSKEHRPQPIVQMGLFLDHNGIPVSFRCV